LKVPLSSLLGICDFNFRTSILKLFAKTFFVFFTTIALAQAFCLNANYPPSLETLTIIATRSDKTVLETAGSDSVITDSDIFRQGSVSLGDVLKYESGVSIPFDFTGADALVPYLNTGEKTINIRGIEGNRIMMSVDGIRQPQEFFTAGGMAGAGRIYFDPATLSQIELFKSASSNLYGSDAMGGAINGRTVGPGMLLGNSLKGSKLKNSMTFASVNASLNNRLLAAYGNGRNAISLILSSRKGKERKNNGIIPPDPQTFLGNAAVLKSITKFQNLEFVGTADLFEQDSFTDVNSIETGNNLSVTHESERLRQRFSLGIESVSGFDMALADDFSGQIYFQKSSQATSNFQDRSDTNSTSRRDISFQSDLIGFDAMIKKKIELEHMIHDLKFGIEISQSDIASKYLKTDFLSDGSLLLEDRRSMAPSTSFNFGFYLFDEISFEEQENWIVSPSLRFDFYEIKPKSDEIFTANSANVGFNPTNYSNLALGSPGLSVINRWNENVNFYFSYNRGVRNPSAEELNGFFEHPPTTSTTSTFIIDANPNLEEEISNSYEIGTHAKLESGIWEFSAFYNTYDGFIELVKQPSPGVVDLYSNDNSGGVKIHGFELSWDSTSIPPKLFSGISVFDFGLSTSWSKGKKTEEKVPLNSIEPWKTVGYISHQSEDESWGFRLTGTYRAAKRADDIDQDLGEPIPISDSFVIDLVGWKKLLNSLEIKAGINNLTNQKFYLWSSARRGGGHSLSSVDEKNTQPGINGFFSLSATF